jgi:OmpA-OmpF porin, OOP family
MQRTLLRAISIALLLGGCSTGNTSPAGSDTESVALGTQVFFDFSSSKLSAESMNSLKTFAANLEKTNNTQKILVCGHADPGASAEVELEVSRERAEAVRQALIDLGMEPTRIAIRAASDSEAVAPTRTQEREPQNRRASVNVEGAAGLGFTPCHL